MLTLTTTPPQICAVAWPADIACYYSRAEWCGGVQKQRLLSEDRTMREGPRLDTAAEELLKAELRAREKEASASLVRASPE